MYTCPACRTEHKRRKDGACPNCGEEVRVAFGVWFRSSEGAPTVALLNHFEKLVSSLATFDAGHPVVWKVPEKSPRYQRELVQAERLLKDAAYDLDLAKKSISILFSSNKFNWRTRTSLMGILGDYSLALAIARAEEEAKEEQQKKEKATVEKIDLLPDLFN